MRFISSSQMKRIDRLVTERFGIPALILMENAGRSVADEAEKMLRNKASGIIVFCGYGNNGGDGFVAARHLINRGYKVKIRLIGKQKKMTKETKINFEILEKMKVNIKRILNQSQIKTVKKYFERTKLLIDAIFGIGMKGRLDNFYCELFNKINSLRIPVVSIDIPSGLGADTGAVLPVAIKANKTITMGLAKKGFLNPKAKKYLGRVIVTDISLPKQLL